MQTTTLPQPSANGNGEPLTARYASKCHKCGYWIRPGDRIEVFAQGQKKRRWAHIDCPAGGPDAVGTDTTARDAIAGLQRAVEALQRRLEAITADGVRTIEIKQANGQTVKIDGLTHPVFEAVLQLAAARKHIFLPGPAGCGKSHLAAQVAEALGLAFGFISCSAGMSESQLLGRMLPTGEAGAQTTKGEHVWGCQLPSTT